MKRLFVLLCLVLVTACSTYQSQYEIRIKAGNFDRTPSPVFVDISLPAVDATAPVCLSDGKTKIPGQIENMGKGIARVWWITGQLEAGEVKDYTLFIGKKCGKQDFQWTDEAGFSTLLTYKEKPVFKYMYTPFDPQDIMNTQKPYHHVYSPDGGELITKGDSGGLYPHHRGIFFGYRETTVYDSLYNTWYSDKGEHTIHKTFISRMAGAVFGGHMLNIDWNDRSGEPFLTETRTILAFKLPDGTTLIDFNTLLETPRDPVLLDGDRQHGGVQFRAVQEVADHDSATRFLRPSKWSQIPEDQEYNGDDFSNVPWDAMQFNIGDNKYTVVYFSDVSNPDNSDFSERQYGRFGEFFPFKVTSEDPLRAHYRFWIINGHDITREEIEKRYKNLQEPIEINVIN
ncbi:PmoA family protein [candidate division KSB1 bacterium]|nr:PmoA family protein [candidate division KSB1 bacterium]